MLKIPQTLLDDAELPYEEYVNHAWRQAMGSKERLREIPRQITLPWKAGFLAGVLEAAKAGEAMVVTTYPLGVALVENPGYPAALELAKWLREQDPSAPVWADVACGGMVISLRTA